MVGRPILGHFYVFAVPRSAQAAILYALQFIADMQFAVYGLWYMDCEVMMIVLDGGFDCRYTEG